MRFSLVLTLFIVPLVPASIVVAFTLQGTSIPTSTFVSSGTDVHVSAWVPYWRGSSGTAEAQRTMLYIDTFSPFIYEVDKDGHIKNRSTLGQGGDNTWTSLLSTATQNSKFIIPTLIWLKGGEQQMVLSDAKKRAAHIREIVNIMKDNKNFHGTDIDYEGRKSGAQVGFSSFITELKKEMSAMQKYLVCTIETRNPNDPDGSIALADRANNYAVLGRECDVVRVMTYDQRNADVVLNKKHQNELYMPIADTEWTEKVLKKLIAEIPKKKVELGIPTYGHVYKYTKNTNNTYAYERMRSLTYDNLQDRIKKYGGSATRTSWGELQYLYSIPSGQFKGDYVAFFSDAAAVAQKVRLAEQYGIRGVAVFSISGANDPQLPLEL